MATQPDARRRTFVLSGGGSGGHIRPLLAVADELKLLEPDSKIISIGDRGSAFAHLTESHQTIDGTKAIFAGKFRRYHGESWVTKLLDVKTWLLNIRDVFYVIFGTVQGIIFIGRTRPDIVFLKGGFVGVPVGIAAAIWRIPIVTHDSDTMPGLANRIVSRWATVHATGMPTSFYNYDPSKARYVGVLVSRDYRPVDEALRHTYRKEISIPEQGSVLLVTGGSLGSQRINRVMAAIVEPLLNAHSDLTIIHQVGKGNAGAYGNFTHPRLQVHEFLNPFYAYSGAADVAVTRAGANNIAELGIQQLACIVIPSPFLAGGHQLKNGEYLRSKKAAVVVDESEATAHPEIVRTAIERLIANPDERQELGVNLASLAVPDAAKQLAEVLIETARP